MKARLETNTAYKDNRTFKKDFMNMKILAALDYLYED